MLTSSNPIREAFFSPDLHHGNRPSHSSPTATAPANDTASKTRQSRKPHTSTGRRRRTHNRRRRRRSDCWPRSAERSVTFSYSHSAHIFFFSSFAFFFFSPGLLRCLFTSAQLPSGSSGCRTREAQRGAAAGSTEAVCCVLSQPAPSCMFMQ